MVSPGLGGAQADWCSDPGGRHQPSKTAMAEGIQGGGAVCGTAGDIIIEGPSPAATGISMRWAKLVLYL